MDKVLIVGGGLAGLASACALAEEGLAITIVESRNRLGGRASSFHDPATGQMVDNCQHVSMGCCTNFSHFCKTMGIDHLLQAQPQLYFLTPDGTVSVFSARNLPAPFHLALSFWKLNFLTFQEKCRVVYGLVQLKRLASDYDPPFLEWLFQQGQTQRIIDRFWGVVLVSALNETPERLGLKYARKVFVDGFLRHPRGFEVEIPTVPLSHFYGDELLGWFAHRNVTIRFLEGVKQLRIEKDKVKQVVLRSEEVVEADWVISAVPQDRLLSFLPEDLSDSQGYFAPIKNLQPSPISSVHLWMDSPLTSLPHAVLLDSAGQWLFNRGKQSSGEYYYQVVVSAARQFRQLSREQIQELIVKELSQLFFQGKPLPVSRMRIVTEHTATFSAVPGVDNFRPDQQSPLENLFLAGDWTATGWPATMEGAVRSGYLAAEKLLRKLGKERQLVQADLR